MKPRLWLVLSLLLAGLAAGAVYLYLQGLQARAEGMQQMEPVVVARQDIPARTRLEAGQLEIVSLPAPYIPSRAVRQVEEIAGGITSGPLYAGQPVLRQQVVQPGDTGQGLGFSLQPGRRAVTVPADVITAVAGFVQPGDRVDVLVSLELPSGEGAGEQETFTLWVLQDIPVLAVGPQLDVGQGKPDREVRDVTLEIKPAEAQNLVLASDQGRLRFLLRSPVDRERVDFSPKSRFDLVDQ